MNKYLFLISWSNVRDTEHFEQEAFIPEWQFNILLNNVKRRLR